MPYSQLSKLAGLNANVENENAVVTRRAVVEIDTRLQSLQAELSRLTTASALTSQLELRLRELNKLKDDYKRLLHPIHRVPPEIIIDIFRRCPDSFSSPATYDSNTGTRRITDAPLAISQISQRWRQIAISCPHLWTNIRVAPKVDAKKRTDPHLSNHQKEYLRDMIQTWLTRSKGLPLSIYIIVSDARITVADVRPFMDLLVAHSDTWQLADILVPNSAMFSAIFPHTKGRLPMLKRLDVGTANGEEVSFCRLPQPDLFLDAPNLSNVSLWSEMTKVSRLPLLPWQQVVSIEVHYFFRVPVIHSFPELQTLFFCNPCMDVEPTGDIETHHNLRSVELASLEQTHHLLQSLTLPSLQTLSVINRTQDKHPEVWNQDIVRSFLSRSVCPLRVLHLLDAHITDTALIELLHLLPMLEDLEIQEDAQKLKDPVMKYNAVTVNDAVLLSLTRTLGDTTTPCPKMTCIALKGAVDITGDCLATMLFSRRTISHNGRADAKSLAHSAFLQSVVVRCPRLTFSRDSRRRIEQLRGTGLTFCVPGYYSSDRNVCGALLDQKRFR